MTTATTEHAWVDRDAYPFRSRWLELAEGKIHYVDEGDGEPVLFVHGTPTWSFEYRHLIAALRGGHRCIAVDHLGFGLSDRPAAADYTPEAHAARLRAFVDKLGLRRFTLVVHDFGGPIALPLALDDPDRVERLVVLNSWMWSFADDPEMTKRARMVSGALGRFLYRRLNASLRLIVPSAYGDRRKLTKAIHRQYLAAFPDADSRERVLWALARALSSADNRHSRKRPTWSPLRQSEEVLVEDDWGFENVLAQLSWARTLGQEGGLFVVVGRAGVQ